MSATQTATRTISPQELHAKSIIIDGVVANLQGWSEKIASSGATILAVAIASGWAPFESAMSTIAETIRAINDDPQHFMLVKSAADMREAKKLNKVGIALYSQTGQPLDNDPGRLELFKELGVGRWTLVHNDRNLIGDGIAEPGNAGLSKLGRRVIKEMNRLRIVVDLTHVGERSSLEAMEVSEAPCIFSHSNPRSRVENLRNITDEQIKRCAEAGGVIGACSWGPVAWAGGDRPPSIDDAVETIQYMVDMVGIDHVGFSTDTNIGTDSAEVRIARSVAYDAIFPEIMDGFAKRWGQDVNSLQYRAPVTISALPKLTGKLLEAGFSAADVQKIMGGNFLRIWEQIWGA